MAEAIIWEFDGVDRDDYDAVNDKLGIDPAGGAGWPEGLIFHTGAGKPGGWVVMTTPRDQTRSRAYYSIMSDRLNFGYRELMDVWQMGLYATENGFDIRRAGVIKAHNGLITKVRASS